MFMIETSRSKKWKVYFSTLAMFWLFCYLMGLTAMIKQPITKEFNFSEQFLGILDGTLFFGSALATLYLSFYPLKKPVYHTFVISIMANLSLQIQLLANIFPDFSHYFFIISRFICGIGPIAAILTITIVNDYLNEQQDKKYLEIWYGTGVCGEVISIFLCYALLNKLQISWEIVVTISAALGAIVSIIMFIVVDEITVENSQNQDVNVIVDLKNKLKQYLNGWQNRLHTLTFILMVSLYYYMLMWLPYFFKLLGYRQAYPFLASSFAIGFSLGSFFIVPIRQKFNNHLGLVFGVTMSISIIMCAITCFLGDDPSQVLAYLLLLFFSTLLMSGFNLYTSTTDLANRIFSVRDFIVINSVNRLFVRLFQTLNLCISGFIISKKLNGFLIYYTGMMFCCLILLVIRLIAFPDSFKPKKYQQIQSLQAKQ